LLFLAFYGATFLVVFKVKPAGTSPAEYLLFMYIGLMAFLGFSEGLSAGAGSLLVNRAILLNTVFPAEMLPLRSVLVGQTTFILGMAIALVWSGIDGRWSWWVLIVPFVMALQIMFLIGVAWLLSPIYLIFRDLGQILNFLVLAIMVISPIAYRADALAGPARLLLVVNPLYYFLACYQATLYDAKGPDPGLLAIAAAVSVTVFVGGFWFFGRVKGALAEHV
jgi:lipopolysaccharide transport system permease protein